MEQGVEAGNADCYLCLKTIVENRLQEGGDQLMRSQCLEKHRAQYTSSSPVYFQEVLAQAIINGEVPPGYA